MKPYRAVSCGLALVLLTGACSSSGDSGSTVTLSEGTITVPSSGEQLSPSTRVPATAWEEVRSRITDPMPLQAAVDAFSVAFHPIDGATPTDLESGYSGSGTGPLRWILGRWDDLSLRQRAEVEQVLTDWEAGATAAAGGAPMDAGFAAAGRALGASPQALVDDVVVSIEALLGRSLSVPIIVKVAGSAAEVDGNRAVMIARNAEGGYTGQLASCTVLYNPKSLTLTGAEAVALAAHEAFHCFEADLADSLEQGFSRPAWIVEGMAEWVGETIAGGSSLSTNSWQVWLEAGELDLFTREYTAIGFYSHVDESGLELWERLDPAMLASDVSSEAAYQALIDGGDADLVDSWAAGYFRDPAHAPVWDQTGPGITLDAPDIPEAYLHAETAYSLNAAPYSAFYAEIDVQSSAEVVTFESPGEGLVMFSDASTAELEDLHGVALCTSGACACPEGTPAAGTQFSPAPLGVMQIAATGHVFGSAVTVVGWSLERFCDEKRCHVGSWETGLWHVPRVIAGGHDIPLAITPDGEGFVDWEEATDLIGIVGATAAGLEVLPLRLVLGGGAHFFVEVVGAEVKVTQSIGAMTITPYLDLGDGWFETGDGSPYLGFGSTDSQATFACAGDTMILNGAIEFWRVSHEAVIPPKYAEMTPTTGAGGPPTTAGALPDVDPCTLLTLAEVQTLSPEAVAPDGPDALDSGFISQCSFGVSLFVQVYPPGGPEFFTDGADMLDLTIVDVPGIGDWALAQVNQPDPQFGIEETVLLVVAGNASGRVGILPGSSVFQGTPQYETLLTLLELALSRL